VSQFRHAGFLAVLERPRIATRAHSRCAAGWSARGDSNPDLHGLNVLRLPFAPRAEMVTTGGFEPPLDRLSTCCLCQVGLHGHWSLWMHSNHHLTG
jgi:hypothetical protein